VGFQHALKTFKKKKKNNYIPLRVYVRRHRRHFIIHSVYLFYFFDTRCVFLSTTKITGVFRCGNYFKNLVSAIVPLGLYNVYEYRTVYTTYTGVFKCLVRPIYISRSFAYSSTDNNTLKTRAKLTVAVLLCLSSSSSLKNASQYLPNLQRTTGAVTPVTHVPRRNPRNSLHAHTHTRRLGIIK